MSKRANGFHCRQKGCPNVYAHVIGGDMAFGKHPKGDCVPCGIAAEMIRDGHTPERLEGIPQMMELMLSHLQNTGWAWGDVKASFERKPVVM